jgi:DNA (cytosine-5)-methyltransferase 1
LRKAHTIICTSQEKKEILDRTAKEQSSPTASWAGPELFRKAKRLKIGSDLPLKSKDMPKEDCNTSPLTLLSLFCGVGGLDLGFREAGFRTALAVDNHTACVYTFRENHPGTIVKQGDVSTLTAKDLDSWVGREIKPIGVIGGPPCQSFSNSNVYQREYDPRNFLPEHYAVLLKELNSRNPIKFIVFENVPGLLGKNHRNRYEKFKELFEEAGFRIFEKVLDAVNYGVAQLRARVIVVGLNKMIYPEAEWIPPTSEKRIHKVKDKILKLKEPAYFAPGLDPKKFPEHPNHWCMVPKSHKFENGSLKEGTVLGRSFRVLSWNEPSWTVAYGHREVHVHPNGHRRLSIFEAMLLQSFPRSYRIYGTLSEQIRLISDAVPPKLAYHIALSIRNCLEI